MIAGAPRAHLWLTVPAGCRIEGELITEDKLSFLFGDPRADGHTIEFDREALERFHTLIGGLLKASPSWGHSILEPERGHVREPNTYVIDGAVVGFAICGAWLVGDLPEQDGDFSRCSVCAALLDERSREEGSR